MYNVLEGTSIVAQLKHLPSAHAYAQRVSREQGKALEVDETYRDHGMRNEWCLYR